MADLKLPSLNKIIIAGRLTRDPEERNLPSGSVLASFAIASGRWYKDKKSGEFKEEVCFVNVTAWGFTAEAVMKKARKGSPVVIEGRLTYSSWESQDGQKRSAVEITADRVQMLEKQGDSVGSGAGTMAADDLPF